MSRALLLVLDSFGIGASADADAFGDSGANTLLHIAQACARGEADTPQRQGPLHLPNLARLGLGHAAALSAGVFPPGLPARNGLSRPPGQAQKVADATAKTVLDPRAKVGGKRHLPTRGPHEGPAAQGGF